MTIASESEHWYYSNGTPCHHVQSKKGNWRPTNLRDARKLNLRPSVTKIIRDVFRAYGIERWVLEQLLQAALTLPRRDDEILDEYAERVIQDSQAERNKAAERGIALHTAIERYIAGHIYPEWKEHLIILDKTLEQYGINLHAGIPEHSFVCGAGYGGKVDYHAAEFLVMDFKSKPTINPKEKLVFDEQAMQIAAYGSGLFGTMAFRGLNVFVGCDDRTVVIHEHTPVDLIRGFSMFSHCLELWKLKNRYWPE